MVAIRGAERLIWVQVTARTGRSTGITPARSPHRTRLGCLQAGESVAMKPFSPGQERTASLVLWGPGEVLHEDILSLKVTRPCAEGLAAR